ncbi:FAD binding domain-containing protein [Haloactinopolyspora sp.]|uniref:FAD binding domain-containing protein n=1 Tax=Haloactinopolyspora sp. TaxID=1966353 RepID=UPI00261F42CC|nr:FAD binding domain-containing protein [Haloactinopolyspora sp.]
MEFLRARSRADAVATKADHPGAVPIAGGTDVMVDVNFDRLRPDALLDLAGAGDLQQWAVDGDTVRLGAGVTYSHIIDQLGDRLPGLAMAARTVGSPQIRNRGTVGGNLGSASPAGDALPPLLAAEAQVEVESVRGIRTVALSEFCTGVKQHVLEADELITAILVPSATGPQQFAKIGTRNAMVIAVCSVAVALHPHVRRVGTGIGSAAPTPRRAGAAERFAARELDWDGGGPLSDDVARRFGELVAAAADPVDDVRGSARYRAHALAVLARRTLGWTWDAYRRG